MNKRVCIAVPVYNSAKTLTKTLLSLVNQKYTNFEIFICDNSSTDGTDSIIAKFKQEYPKLINHIVNPVVQNGEANWIYMLNNLPKNIDYVALFHSDDIYDSSIIAEQVDILNSTNAGAAFAAANLIDENDQNINTKMKYSPFLPKDLHVKDVYDFEEIYICALKHHNFIKTPSAMFRYSTLIKYEPLFNKEFKSSADLDLWFRIAKKDGISIINKPLFNYRITPTQGSQVLSKGRIQLADYFTVMDFHSNESLKKHQNIKYYETMRAMDYVICSYNLLRHGKNKDAFDALTKSLQTKHFLNIFKIKNGYKHLLLGCILYFTIKTNLKSIFNRYIVLDI